MRLTQQQINTIKKATEEIFGPDAHVWLFGSRVDDARRGGDIDLMVETGEKIDKPALLAARLAARISRKMHGRRIDVVIDSPDVHKLPIHRIARTEGIRL
jgi:uncharacterized protein